MVGAVWCYSTPSSPKEEVGVDGWYRVHQRPWFAARPPNSIMVLFKGLLKSQWSPKCVYSPAEMPLTSCIQTCLKMPCSVYFNITDTVLVEQLQIEQTKELFLLWFTVWVAITFGGEHVSAYTCCSMNRSMSSSVVWGNVHWRTSSNHELIFTVTIDSFSFAALNQI